MSATTQLSKAVNGRKEVFLPDAGSTDPVAHSVSENLFWTDQLMEHAAFFVMLMPGPELADVRAQAEGFQATFAGQFVAARKADLDTSNFAAFNHSTIELVKPFMDFKATWEPNRRPAGCVALSGPHSLTTRCAKQRALPSG